MDHAAPRPSRRMIVGAGLTGVLGGVPLARACAGAPSPQAKAPGFYRFPLGDALVTVVSDGRAYASNPTKTFTGAPPEEIAAALEGNFLEADRLAMDENVVVADIGGRVVMFDCGSGSSTLFGKSGGRLPANLAAAGIDPSSIGAIILSHAHPDHIGGLMTDAGTPQFPNAQLYLSQEEYDFWTDPTQTGPRLSAFHDLVMRQVVPNRDRLHFIRDGQEVVPGVMVVASPGHTSGHVHFLLNSAGRTLACTADLSRHRILGLEKRWEFIGDHDPKLSLKSLDRHIGRYADERTQILSYHYPWPGLGHVVRWDGRFRYVPTGMDMS